MKPTNRPLLATSATLVTLLALGCGSGPEPDTPITTDVAVAQTDTTPDSGARLAQFETGPTADGLPEGHPTVDSGALSNLPPVAVGTGTGTTDLAWETPENWSPEPPANAMRWAQYRVPGEEGEAQCVVYYFGPGQGGDAQANAERWAQQFEQPDGSPSLAALETESLDIDGVSVLMVEITGIYQASQMMGGTGQAQPGYMLLGAIAEGSDANWFFKLTGPESTVRAHHAAFETMIRSLRAGA